MHKDKTVMGTITRSDSEIIELTPMLERWFDEATKVYDQALYYLRDDYFGQQRLRKEAFEKGTDYKCSYKKFSGDESLYKLVSAKMKGTLTIPSHLFNGIVASNGIGANWKGFLKSIKDYSKSPSKYTGRPKPPNYRTDRETGTVRKYTPITFYRGSGHFQNINKEERTFSVGKIRQPDNHLTLKVPDRVNFDTFTCVKLVRYYDKVKVMYIYEKETTDCGANPENVLGIDLGVGNIASMTLNGRVLDGSWLIKGGTLKSINTFYNRRLRKCKSVLAHTGGGLTSKRIVRLNKKRAQKIDYEMHCISKRIVQLCVENKVGRIVIGHNKGWKTSPKLGKSQKKNFIQIPFDDLVWKLKYKAEEFGIAVEEIEESYTSKVNHVAGEKLPDFGKTKTGEEGKPAFSGKRAGEKSVFRTGVTAPNGKEKLIHDDINGAIGILRKAGAISDSELKHVLERKDVLTPEVLRYRESQGAILGKGRGKTGSWKGDASAEMFMKNDRTFVKNLPPGISMSNLKVSKTDKELKNPWVIVDSKGGSVVDDANGFGFATCARARNMLRCYRSAEDSTEEV